jgi:hypothetical protein
MIALTNESLVRREFTSDLAEALRAGMAMFEVFAI